MSNRVPPEKSKGGSTVVRSGAVWLVGLASLSSGQALAQSAELLESVRVHQPAARALAYSDLQACRERKGCRDEARLSLLAGYLALADGDAAGAAEQLASAPPPKGLEAFHAWYLGEAYSWSGQRNAALLRLAAVKRKGTPAWLARKAELRLAEVALSVGQAARARTVLESAAAVDPTPENLLSRGLARQATGDRAKALADFTAIALRFPAHPHAALALEQRAALGGKPFSGPERLVRAQAYLAAGRAERTLEELQGLEGGASVNAAQLALVRGQALLVRGQERDQEALAQLEVAAQGSASIAAQALNARARRLMRLGENAAARLAFQQLDARFPDDSLADEAGYLAAWLAMNAGDDATAIKDFAAYEVAHRRSKKVDEARWFRCYALIRLGRLAEARALLLSLPVDFPRSSLVPQSRYWATRAAQLAGQSDGGPAVDLVAEYGEVITAAPATFYARLAMERLRELSAPVPTIFRDRPRRLEAPTPPALALAVTLSQAGLFRDAAEEVHSALGQVTTPAEALSWGHALQRLGDYGAAYTLAARHLWGAVHTQQQPEAVALLYPRAYQPAVERWSTQHGLDPHFAWAIMRRESAFRPEVTSSADARGLMQLIPPTADGITAATKEPKVDPAQLYGPETSIRLGTWYLAALFQRMAHPTLVAGSYNGGPPAVAKWMGQRGDLPLDRWVEEIPWKETRGYVKQVVADYYLYRHLYGAPATQLSLTLPAPQATGVDF